VRGHDRMQAPDAKAPAQSCLLLSRYVTPTIFTDTLSTSSPLFFQMPYIAKMMMVNFMYRRAKSGSARPCAGGEQDQHQTHAIAASDHQLHGGAHATHF
jgi:hypothetical protein